jgi:hypothetical protein
VRLNSPPNHCSDLIKLGNRAIETNICVTKRAEQGTNGGAGAKLPRAKEILGVRPR